jgi:hypothetical protein
MITCYPTYNEILNNYEKTILDLNNKINGLSSYIINLEFISNNQSMTIIDLENKLDEFINENYDKGDE